MDLTFCAVLPPYHRIGERIRYVEGAWEAGTVENLYSVLFVHLLALFGQLTNDYFLKLVHTLIGCGGYLDCDLCVCSIVSDSIPYTTQDEAGLMGKFDT